MFTKIHYEWFVKDIIFRIVGLISVFTRDNENFNRQKFIKEIIKQLEVIKNDK